MLIPDDLDMELDRFVERFEIAHAKNPGVDVAPFMPAAQHPRYAQIACELLRVHMELSAATGRFISADEYRQKFPQACEQTAIFKALQAEEHRVRTSSLVAQRAASTSLSTNTSHSHVPTGQRVEMPKAGQSVCGFRLLTELGRGAFSQVFLAQDDSLSGRRVVLKISSKLLGEADLLSRLQHKNIVPVYSLHRYGQYHLICMPFLGTMTLGDMINAQPTTNSALSGRALISTLAAQASRTWKEEVPYAASSTTTSATTSDSSSASSSNSSTASSTSSSTASSSASPSEAVPVSDATDGALHLDRGLSSQLATEVARMSTTELALWIVSELADGLAHAHQRGVLHRDIKPANILLSDDGLPMLLDFNLAASIEPNDRSHQVVGGTLRYMSPEQLRAVQSQRSSLDARADVFGLGVVLYELLYRRSPYPDRTGAWSDVLEQMLSDRQQLPAIDVNWRDGLTPAVASMLSRSLACDPDTRYQSASEFRDDLRAQLQARPLLVAKDRSLRERVRKWNTRHPRLSSMTIAAGLVGLLLCGTAAWTIHRQSQVNRLQALQWLSELEHSQSDARTLLASELAPASAIEKWLQRSLPVLAENVEQNLKRLSVEDAVRARQCLARLHFYRARGAVGMIDRTAGEKKNRWIESALDELKFAQNYEPTQMAQEWQKSLQLLARSDAENSSEIRLASQHPEGKLVSANAPASTSPALKMDAGTVERELDAAISTAHVEASNPWQWLAIGQMQLTLGQLEPASASFRLSHTLAQQDSLPAFFLGLIAMKQKQFREADDWFTFVLAEDRQCWEAWLNRASTRVELARFEEAIEDVKAMGDQVTRYPRAWFVRELAETRLGRKQAAQNSREQGLKLTPTDALGWNARGQARLRHKPVNAEEALADFEMAIRIDPRLRNSYENAAHVLSEQLNQAQAAIDRLSEVLKIDPEYALAWSSRAVLLARQADFGKAMDDIEHALRLDRSPMICYQCASALALREAAGTGVSAQGATNGQLTSMQLLKETLRKDVALSRFMSKDQDLKPLLDNPEFKELMHAAARLQ